MSKISDMLDQAGARAEAVPAVTRELLLHLEERVEALEGLNTPRAAPDAAKLAKAKAALAEAEKAIGDDAAQS